MTTQLNFTQRNITPRDAYGIGYRNATQHSGSISVHQLTIYPIGSPQVIAERRGYDAGMIKRSRAELINAEFITVSREHMSR